MSLDHILLGHLARPATGYELKKEFEAGAGLFWPVHPSQMYATLDRLEERGFLSSSMESSDRGPDRRVYTRTDRGTEALRAWIADGPDAGRARLPYLGQLASLGQYGDKELARRFLSRLRDDFAARVAHLRQVEQIMLRDRDPATIDDETFFDWAAMRVGVAGLEARVASCERLLDLLERRDS